jgi:hypothetical protein
MTDILSGIELDKLDPHGILELDGAERYTKYRKRGFSPESAYAAACAWQRNVREQHERRKSHDTGAQSPERGWSYDELDRRLRERP